MEGSQEDTVIDIDDCDSSGSDDNEEERSSSENENSDNNVSEEESNSENEENKTNECEEDSNNEQTVLSSNDEESNDIYKTKDGSIYARPTVSNPTPESSSSPKKEDSKKWKGKGKSDNVSGGTKKQEHSQKQRYNAYHKSGACNKNVSSVQNTFNSNNYKCPNVRAGNNKAANSSLNQKSNQKGKSIRKNGNSQAWKNASNDGSNKNNYGNNCNNSHSKKNESINNNASKGKDNQNNTFNNNKNNNKSNNNNNNNNNSNNNNNNNNNNKNNNNNNNNKKKNSNDCPPSLNIRKEVIEVVKSIFKKRLYSQPLDTPTLRLHYRFTVLLFVLLYTMIQGCWIWKESIICVYGNNAEITVPYHIKNFCLSYSFVYEGSHDSYGEDEDERRYLLFYRWTHLSFLIIAALFYIPRVIAKSLDNPRLKQLVHDLAVGEHRYDCSNWEKDTNMMLQYLNNHASTHGYLYLWLIICHVAAMAIDCLVVLYFDYVLQGNFMKLVYSAYPLHREPRFFTDYLSRTFPPFVRCKLEKQVLINNAREEELGCHLLLMEIYDKMFVLVWVWLVFLIFSTGITIIALFLWMIPPCNRLFLFMQKNSQYVKKLRNKIVKTYHYSDLYALYLMKRHRSETQFIMLMSKLVHSEEITSSTDHLPEVSPKSGREQWCTKDSLHFSPILLHEETIRSRKINSSCCEYEV